MSKSDTSLSSRDGIGIRWRLDEVSGKLSVVGKGTVIDSGMGSVLGTSGFEEHIVTIEAHLYITIQYRAEPKAITITKTTNVSPVYYSMKILISLLQKAVRLGRSETAARVAVQIMSQPNGGNEFLRRMFIVMIEDVCVQPWLPFIAAYMVLCSKGVELTPRIIQRLACCAWELASITHIAFPIVHEEQCIQELPNPSTWCLMVSRQIDLPENKQNLLLAFALRIAYGGMSGDMQMLHGTAYRLSTLGKSSLWDISSSALTSATSKAVSVIHPFLPDYTPPIALDSHVWDGLNGSNVNEHLLPTAVDFHCSDIIDNLIERIKRELGIDVKYHTLKKWIWQHRSRTNVRSCLYLRPIRSTVETPLVYSSVSSLPSYWFKICLWMDEFATNEWARPATPKKINKRKVPPSQRLDRFFQASSPPSQEKKTRRECIVLDE